MKPDEALIEYRKTAANSASSIPSGRTFFFGNRKSRNVRSRITRKETVMTTPETDSLLRSPLGAALLSILLVSCSGEAPPPENAPRIGSEAATGEAKAPEGMVLIPGGTFLMGSQYLVS